MTARQRLEGTDGVAAAEPGDAAPARVRDEASRVRDEADALLASLATPEGRADPYPIFARLRALAPQHRSASGSILLTRYDDCASVTRNPEYRAQSPAWADRVIPGWRDSPGQVATFETMLFRDPPDHARLRKLVSGAFTPRKVDSLRGEVAALADRALDAVADACADGGTADLQGILAPSLAMPVIGRLVGVPETDWRHLRASISALLNVVELFTSKKELAEADAAALALRRYFADLVAERRRSPLGDLASALVATRDSPDARASGDGSRLTEEELLQTLTFLFMAGVDTMINLLANGTAALIAHPAQAELLRGDHGLAAAAVEEALRYDPPVQFVARVPAADATIGGVPVPADSLVIALLGAANRDPARFTAPDRFDISRTGPAVLSFGGGIHFCLGAALARLQAGVFFPALVNRFPTMQLASPPVRRGVVLRGFAEFLVCARRP